MKLWILEEASKETKRGLVEVKVLNHHEHHIELIHFSKSNIILEVSVYDGMDVVIFIFETFISVLSTIFVEQ